jgi:hypothetical protein
MRTFVTKVKNRLFLIGFLLLGLSLAGMTISCRETKTNNPREVTFVQLFTSPDQYNGSLITIEGFYFQGFEVNVLSEKLENSGYVPEHLIPKGKMVWIEGGIPKEVYDKLSQQQMMGPLERYGKIRITGRFEYGGKYGHLGGYNSQITPNEVKLLTLAQ